MNEKTRNKYLHDVFLIEMTNQLKEIKKNNKPIKITIYNPYKKDSKTICKYDTDIEKLINKIERKINSHVKKYYPEVIENIIKNKNKE